MKQIELIWKSKKSGRQITHGQQQIEELYIFNLFVSPRLLLTVDYRQYDHHTIPYPEYTSRKGEFYTIEKHKVLQIIYHGIQHKDSLYKHYSERFYDDMTIELAKEKAIDSLREYALGLLSSLENIKSFDK